MKKTVTLIFLLSCFMLCKSQDVIMLKNGDEISSKILEVNADDIKYKKADNLNGPTFSVRKSDVFILKYENGTKDVINPATKSSSTGDTKMQEQNISTTSSDNAGDICDKGRADSRLYYKGYKGAATGTFVTTLLLGGIPGLIPAVACSSTPPSEENLMYPSSQSMKNLDYSNCYRSESKSIKSKKVWSNFGIALAIDFAVLLLIISSSGSGG